METVHRGNAAMKMSRIPGYAGGGLLDKLKSAVGMQTSKQVMDAKVAAEMKRRTEQEQQPAPTPTPTQAAPMGNQTIIDKRMVAAGAAQGAKIKPGMAKEAMGSYPAMGGKKKSDRGGMLKGPGTPTSDSIPAEVVDTGEPIKVATGERIVSKKQDAYLQKIAKDMGFPSVDAMLEAGTGEPVGPTLKYDDEVAEGEMSRGAAGGASPDDLRRQLMVSQTPTGGAGPSGIAQPAVPGAAVTARNAAAAATPAATAPVGPPAPNAMQKMARGFENMTGITGKAPSVAGPVLKSAGKVTNVVGKAAPYVAVGNEALQVGQVALDPNASKMDVATQAAQGAGRLGAAGVGAAAGAAMGSVVPVVGTAIGGVLGGVAGYMGADKLIESGRKLMGSDPRSPSQQVAAREQLAAVPTAGPATPAAVATPAQAPEQDFTAANAAKIAAANAAAPAPKAGDVTNIGPDGRLLPEGSQSQFNGREWTTISTPEAKAARATADAAFNTRMDSENAAVNARMQAEIARGKALPSQYEKEVAGAQAVNEAGRRMNLEYDLRNGNRQERMAAQAILSSIDATEKDKRGNAVTTRGQDMGLARDQMSDVTAQRGQNITSRGQDIQAGALRASQKLAQDQFGLSKAKDGRESAASAMAQKSLQQLMDAQQEFLNAKTPDEVKAAERKLTTLGGKQQSQDEYAYAPGGQAVVDGQLVTQPGVVFNKRTGQPAQQSKPGVPDAATARTQAMAALKANPANKDEINKRLAAAGYQPI